jgi:predicted nucleic acid-binding Zn finger protein
MEEAGRDHRLTIEIIVKLADAFGEKFFKALETVRGRRVKRYKFVPGPLEIATVIGSKREYLLLPDVWYCSCKGLYPRRLQERLSICYHLLAYKLAEALDLVQKMEMEADRYDDFLSELKYGLE